jgi:hypothetical protein
MPINPENSQEVENKISFSEVLTRLSATENPAPLNPKEINVLDLRNQLAYAGINFIYLENNEIYRKSINQSQFRDSRTGRGPAVVAAFKSQENYQKYYNWAKIESDDQPLIDNMDETSKSIGLRQFAADILALASYNMTPEKFCQKTNWRVGKKFKKDPELSKAFGLPTDPEGRKKLRETASIPKGSAIKAYEFILKLNK